MDVRGHHLEEAKGKRLYALPVRVVDVVPVAALVSRCALVCGWLRSKPLVHPEPTEAQGPQAVQPA